MLHCTRASFMLAACAWICAGCKSVVADLNLDAGLILPPSCGSPEARPFLGPFTQPGFLDWGEHSGSAVHFPTQYWGTLATSGSDRGAGWVIWNGPLVPGGGPLGWSAHSWGVMAATARDGQLLVKVLEDAGVPSDNVPRPDLPIALPPLLAVGDFDEDGLLDYVWGRAVVPFRPEHPMPLIELSARANGSTYTRLPIPETQERYLLPWCTEVGDFNGDGHLDLLECSRVGQWNDERAFVALGDGTGHFSPGPSWDLPWYQTPTRGHWLEQPGAEWLIPVPIDAGQYGEPIYGMGLVSVAADGGPVEVMTNLPWAQMWCGDLNGDGLDDAIGGKGAQIFWNRGKGVFEPGPILLPGLWDSSYRLAMGHFTGSPRIEVAVLSAGARLASCTLDYYEYDFPYLTCVGGSSDEAYGTLSVLREDGDGGYCTEITQDAGAVPWLTPLTLFTTAELSGSGRSDLAYTTWQGIAVLLNPGP
jgi:hypothetical protein